MVHRASQLAPAVKTLPANPGDVRELGSIPGLGRSPEGGHGNPLQYFCLKNPHGERSQRGYSQRVAKSWTQLKQLSTQRIEKYTQLQS